MTELVADIANPANASVALVVNDDREAGRVGDCRRRELAPTGPLEVGDRVVPGAVGKQALKGKDDDSQVLGERKRIQAVGLD